MADSVDVHDGEGRSVVDALRADGSGEQLDPPMASPMQLPSRQLSPPMFERLVAEFALRVDGLSRIRIYGRSGQSQGGLDLIGWDSKGLTIYQVRRVEGLSAAGLRKAVTDFAEPKTKEGCPKPRRFDARRFVLVTGCVVDDRNVDDELVKLKAEYEGDLEIDLYDNTELSARLRYRGPLVHGIFGPAWAEAYCGFRPPPSTSKPPGRAYLADPVDILGLSDVRSRAHELAESEPESAAEMFGGLAQELEDKGFAPHARQVRAFQLKAYRDADRTDQTLSVAVGLAIADYEDGTLFPGVRHVAELVEQAGPEAQPLVAVLDAIAGWFEQGYDLVPVVENLSQLLEAGIPHAATLLIIVAEQVLADDDPRDDHEALLRLSERWLNTTKGLEQLRLRCCAADFRIWSGTAPDEAYRELQRLAFAGHVGADQAAFIHRRCGRALASTDPDAAVDHYRRAVLEASESGLGGDVREALRALAFLAEGADSILPMKAARSVADRARLLDGVDRVVIDALESLAEDKLPQALRSTHDWVRRERINGALMDEVVALRRYGRVYARAGEHAHAARALIRGGARKAAKQAAADAGSDYVDVSTYLQPRQLAVVQEAAAACVASQADYVPDDRVEALCSRLLELADRIGTEQHFASQTSIEALRALAAFGKRLPAEVGEQLLTKIEPLIERKQGTYRYCDEAVLDLLETCARHPAADLVERGVAGLVRCIAQQVHRADNYLHRAGQSDQAVRLLRPLAEGGNRVAVELLASWDVVTPAVRASALASARGLLERPVGQPRSEWALGEGVQEAAVKLRAVLEADPSDPELVEVRDRLAEHLLCWAEDEHDVAESRSDAVHAIRILSPELPEQTRTAAVDRLQAVHDEPRFSQMDEYHQESLHPLSRFRFNTGSDWFPADCLFAAAVLADSATQWSAVWSRVAAKLSDPEMSKEVAVSLGRAARSLNDIRPIDVSSIAGHRQPTLRQAAVICWAQDPGRDPAYAARFATDDNWLVRAHLANVIERLEPDSPMYEAVARQLRQDSNRQVRDLLDAV